MCCMLQSFQAGQLSLCLAAAVIVEQVLVKLRAHAEDIEKEA